MHQCTPEEKNLNLDIINNCNSSWDKWGISPKPKASELRDPNNCSGLATLGTLEGCADALVAFPIFMGEMALRGLLATLPTNKKSFAYVSQNGSLNEIKGYLINEFMKEQCGVNPSDTNTYVDRTCPQTSADTNSHLNPQNAKSCTKKALNDVYSARKCFRSSKTRAAYRTQAFKLKTQARDIKDRQDKRKAQEAKFKKDLKDIKSACGYHLNRLNGSMSAYLMPVPYLAIEAKNALLPNKGKVQAFNDCVERKTRGKKDLREALLKNSTGLIEQISGNFESIKCYNEKERKALKCEIVLGVVTGGAGLSFAAAKKLGKAGVEQYTKRVASHKNTINANKTAEYSKESANASLLQTAKENPGAVISADAVTPSGEAWKSVFSYEKQSVLPKKRRNFLKKLRLVSNPGTAKNREYAGYIVEYEDGSTAAVQFTSNKYSTVTNDDWIKARDLSNVENRGGRVKKVIHIHTHPWDSKISSMLPSDGDVGFYKEIIESNDDFDKYLKFDGDVDFEAYILPVCDGCEDVIIRMNKEQVKQSGN